MSIKQDAEKRVNNKIECLKLNFEKQYRAWKQQGVTDDRSLFCNVYDLLMEATEAMRSVDNSYVWCAFNHEFNKDYGTLKEIKDRFFYK